MGQKTKWKHITTQQFLCYAYIIKKLQKIKFKNMIILANGDITIIDGIILTSWNKTQDQYFMQHNQIGLIIHAACRQLPQNIAPNLQTIQFQWQIQQKISSVLLRYKCKQILQYIHHNAQEGNNTIICDYGITSKSIGICCLILMYKFRWSLLKTLEYIHKKIDNFNFNQQETKCLLLYDKNLRNNFIKNKIHSWEDGCQISEEAMLARNTFLNTTVKKSECLIQYQNGDILKKKKKVVSFSEDKPLRQSVSLKKCVIFPTRFATYQKNTFNLYDFDFQPNVSKINLSFKEPQPQRKRRFYSCNNRKLSDFIQITDITDTNFNKTGTNFNRTITTLNPKHKQTKTKITGHTNSQIKLAQSYQIKNHSQTLKRINAKISQLFKQKIYRVQIGHLNKIIKIGSKKPIDKVLKRNERMVFRLDKKLKNI